MKKRILYIGNALSNKGATVTSIETLGAFLKEEGYAVTTASSQKIKAFRMLDMIYCILRYGKSCDYVLIDTYSTSNYWYAVITGRLCQLLSLPYIPILRGGNLPHRLKSSKKSAQNLFKNAHKNIAPSAYMSSIFEKEGFTNIYHIPNTIALGKYTFIERTSIRPKLLWVRSFSKIYNPLLAIKVLQELQKEYPAAVLTMVGPAKDESYDECYAFAKAQKLPVTFTGLLPKEDWIDLAASHDIFISTTNFDNTPVSVIEAMALGLPVISTHVGGMPFLISHEYDGLLCPPGQLMPLVNSVKQLLAAPEMAMAIAKNARSKAAKFDWNEVKNHWEEVLS